MTRVLLRTPRLKIRRLSRQDLPDFQAYRTDPALARYQGWEVKSDDAAAAFLAAHEDIKLFNPGCWHQLGIATSDNQLIGDIGVFLSADGTGVELGITLRQVFHGQGYASEALAALIDWL